MKQPLVGGLTQLKNMLIKLDHESPGLGVKIKNMGETTN